MVSKLIESKREKTIRRILDAAANIFSESGFEGARVDEIAKQAKINKAMIYYHIGDKKALYAEVLHDIIGNATEHFISNLDENQSSEQKLKYYINSVTQTMEQNPFLAPIMMREQASGGQNLPEIIAKEFALIIGMVTNILEEGAKQGVFIKTTPFIIHSMVIGGIMFYQTSYPVRSGYAAFPETVKKLGYSVSGDVSKEIEKLILKAVKK
ncbi:MAG: TetR/AcrR family transcriptional regulator [Desulfobacula sp.]|uniref:TetR/AcrR family transcriptional regulator n=1 Tax=Desulfobacula sp. TaxID=2593537 RepID=UPI0025C1A58A|nr:TetR/AcrR family transcriptional regulator [Desulfobacula sp.]MCD4723095.1 TetR/AcrR family transcriptional regulator [Desulfobacula sp.]